MVFRSGKGNEMMSQNGNLVWNRSYFLQNDVTWGPSKSLEACYQVEGVFFSLPVKKKKKKVEVDPSLEKSERVLCFSLV